MRKTLLCMLGILLCTIVHAQSNVFSKVIYSATGQVTGNAISNAQDNGYYIIGRHNNSAIFMKLDSAGNFLWSKSFSAAGLTEFNAFTPTQDSCYVLAGTRSNPVSGDQDIFLVKVNSIGDTLWTKSIPEANNSYAYAIHQTSDGGYLITGKVDNAPSPPSAVMFVAKTNGLGTVSWNKTFSVGNFQNIGSAIKETPDGGFAIYMTYHDYPPFHSGAALLKFDMTGALQWANKYQSIIAGEDSRAIDFDPVAGGIFLFGTNRGTSHFLKTDYSGAILWQQGYNEYCALDYGSVAAKLSRTYDGHYVCATNSPNTHMPSSVMKLDTNGTMVWNKYLNSAAISILQAKDTGYMILSGGPMWGVGHMPTYNDHIAIIKTDSLGQGSVTGCISATGGNSPNTDSLYATAFTPVVTLFPTSSYSLPITVTSPSYISEIGCVTFLGSIQENTKQELFVYPNPSNGTFTLTGWRGDGMIDIFDATGKNIYHSPVKEKTKSIELNPNAKGIYFYRFTESNSKTYQGKLSIH